MRGDVANDRTDAASHDHGELARLLQEIPVLAE